MKKVKNKIVFALSFIALGGFLACGGGSSNKVEKEVDSEGHFSSVDNYESIQMSPSNFPYVTDITDAYFALRDALAEDQEEAAKNNAEMLKNATENVEGFNTVDGESLEGLEELFLELGQAAEQISISDIKEQRSIFEGLTATMTNIYHIAGIDRQIFVQYCPMYDNNKGGYWLSGEPHIYNPLFGHEMLSCGVIEAELTNETETDLAL